MEAFTTFVTNHMAFAIVMFAMSLAAAALVAWRLMLNFNARTDMDRFLGSLQQELSQNGPAGALTLCQREKGMIPRLLARGLHAFPQGTAAMRRSMASAIELEFVPDLNYLLPSIMAIAKIATMVGLLGTVVSMIGTFQVLGEAAKSGKAGGSAQASTEIGLALFATALGLVTAIPLVFAHVLFKANVHKVEIQMKSNAQKLLALVQEYVRTKPATKATAPNPSAAVAHKQ
ncbi:MAG TPA: MotA/TolQ/ExbB proton channel family protein [Pirellulales bacterium]|jgi:biopolymer transport protein ExbB